MAEVIIRYNVDTGGLEKAKLAGDDLKAATAGIEATYKNVDLAAEHYQQTSVKVSDSQRDLAAKMVAMDTSLNTVKIGMMNLRSVSEGMPVSFQKIIGSMADMADGLSDAAGAAQRMAVLGGNSADAFDKMNFKGAAGINMLGALTSAFSSGWAAGRKLHDVVLDLTGVDLDMTLANWSEKLDSTASAFENASQKAHALREATLASDDALGKLGVATIGDATNRAAELAEGIRLLTERFGDKSKAIATLTPQIREWYDGLKDIPGVTRESFGETTVLNDVLREMAKTLGPGVHVVDEMLRLVDANTGLKSTASEATPAVAGLTQAMSKQSDVAKELASTIEELNDASRSTYDAYVSGIRGMTDESKQALAEDLKATQDYAKAKIEELEKAGKYVEESLRVAAGTNANQEGDKYDAERKQAERERSVEEQEREFQEMSKRAGMIPTANPNVFLSPKATPERIAQVLQNQGMQMPAQATAAAPSGGGFGGGSGRPVMFTDEMGVGATEAGGGLKVTYQTIQSALGTSGLMGSSVAGAGGPTDVGRSMLEGGVSMSGGGGGVAPTDPGMAGMAGGGLIGDTPVAREAIAQMRVMQDQIRLMMMGTP